jgi:primosomal protein N'
LHVNGHELSSCGELQMSVPAEALLVEVALLPSPASLPDSLTYRVPPHLEGQAAVGMPAIAPLGGRELLGYIVAAERKTVAADDTRLRSILAVPRAEPAFDETMLSLMRWVAREYGCHLSEALPLAVPERYGASLQSVLTLGQWDGEPPPRAGALTRQTLGRLREVLSGAGGVMSRDDLEAQIRLPNLPEVLRKARTEGWVTEDRVLMPPRVHSRKLKGVRAAELPEEELEAALKGLGAKQREVMDYLWERAGETVLRAQIYQVFETDSSTLARMVKRGLIDEVQIEVRRAPQIKTTGAPARPKSTRSRKSTRRSCVGKARACCFSALPARGRQRSTYTRSSGCASEAGRRSSWCRRSR